MPQTPEEFKDVLIAFRDEDPNGNGVKDESRYFAKAWSWVTAMETCSARSELWRTNTTCLPKTEK